MFMIILAHSGAPEEYTWLYNPFFLSAFFFVSGYTFRPMQNAKEFVIHKLKGQVYPFAVFGFINAVIAVLVEHDSWIDRYTFDENRYVADITICRIVDCCNDNSDNPHNSCVLYKKKNAVFTKSKIIRPISGGKIKKDNL